MFVLILIIGGLLLALAGPLGVFVFALFLIFDVVYAIVATCIIAWLIHVARVINHRRTVA